MPSQKDLKRLVRARMQKTGESYTTARRHLLARRERRAGRTGEPSAAPSRPSATALAELAGIKDATVRERTGKSWADWVRALDAAGGASLSHKEIARHVHETYEGVSGWWAQSVTVGYERIRGLRDVGQRRGGGYDANKSRTFPVSIAKLYRAWSDKRARVKWLPDDLTIRSSVKEKSMRITMGDGTTVQAYFTAKAPSKSSVALQHRSLPTKAASESAKLAWSARLDTLKTVLAGR